MLPSCCFVGYVVSDPRPKATENNSPYLHLYISVPVRYGERRKSLFLDAVFWEEKDAMRVIKAQVKKNSLIQLTGGIEDNKIFQDSNGELKTVLEIRPYRWEFVPSGRASTPAMASHEAEASMLAPPPQLECSADGTLPV